MLNEKVWRKSSYSGGDGGQCVEWASAVVPTRGVVFVRDSKEPYGPVLTVSPTAWASFIAFAARERTR
ncbi:DUF397 domain-containing protein [Streptomyces varsoviensis]|uniref:DUF397 domain-containing protein n=1 Tax=Streptomyces varsoviensis TaxID=67373 RepID=A0ABR5ISA6_9ACTN|nr:DUF397 domain-containing protein [Streptomyces varsoviensis]KOG51965.1 hypothetical protein ADK38_44425 [Streptomyces varsoviensis]